MLAGMQRGAIGAARVNLGTLGCAEGLCWEGSSFQSKLEAPEVRVEVV